jgi:hypothetical protein
MVMPSLSRLGRRRKKTADRRGQAALMSGLVTSQSDTSISDGSTVGKELAGG